MGLHRRRNIYQVPIFIICLMCHLFTACSMDEDFPLPTNPVEKYAFPKSVIILTVNPDPVPSGLAAQTWIIREINDVGMRIDSIRMNTYSTAGILTSTRKLIESDIVQLWESTYIPPLWSGAGARQTEISGESGSTIIISLFGHDDNQYKISAADTLSVQ